jgi:Ca2+-binding RTX toxin-like protein
VLGALRDLANGTGSFNVGAALDVVNAASTAASVREFLNGLVEKSLAHVAEGAQLLINPNTTMAQARDYFARGVQMDLDAQQASRDQAISIVADQAVPGGGMVFDAYRGAKSASETNSFVLGATIPGLPVNGADKVDVVWGSSGSDTIRTLAGNDAVMGFGGNDIISGGPGRDWLAGGAGDDSLDGGPDLDAALYTGGRLGYTIQKTGQGFSVSGPDGSDTLTGIERLMFADTAVGLDVDGTGGKAYRIYQAAFNRAPDTGGLGYWIKVLDDGAALRDVAQGFMGTAEFQSAYGTNPSNAQLVGKFYENVLHRPPDEGGFTYWLGILNQGLDTAAGALANISESPENQTGVIGVIQNGFEYTPYG